MKLYRYGKGIEKLGQRYRLDGSLGNGGMADICLAWDEKNQREVAIKILKTHQLDPAMLNRFIREGSLIRSWQHPHIIQIYDDVRMELLDPQTGSTIPYLIMEYLRGGTLEDRLKTGQPYPLPQILPLFDQLCDALQYAHDHGVIHRDLKPSNILFKNPPDAPNAPGHSVLSDFGLAVSMLATHHTFSHGGTPLYMAPEQLRGKTVQASDIFALGIILYRLCTGQMPFQLFDLYKTPLPTPPKPSDLHTALPKDLDPVILSTLSEDPQQRPTSALLLWQLLQNAVAERPFLDEEEDEHVGPNLVAGAAGSFAPDNLAGQQRLTNLGNDDATQAINLDSNEDDAFQLPSVESVDPATSAIPRRSGTNVSVPASVVQTSGKMGNNETSAEEAANAGPDIINFSPQKGPQSTLPLPERSSRRGNNVTRTDGAAGGVIRVAATSGGWVMRTPPPTTPLPAPTVPERQTPRRSRRKRWPLVALFLLLIALLVCASLALAYPAVFKTFMGTNISLSETTSLTTVSITPASQIVSNSYIITGVTGTPDPKQQTVKARNLNSSAQSAALPISASGHDQIPGKSAAGTLTFYSDAPQALTIGRSTFHANGIAFTMDSNVTIPAFDGTTISTATVSATADSVGTAGNISVQAINQTCCVTGVSVRNNTAFAGGVDAAGYSFVTQADVNSAVTPAVQNQLAQKAANQLKSQLAAGEVFAESPQCQTSTASSNPVGDHGQNVDGTSVTVTENCSSVSYDDQGMRTLVTNLLTQKAQVSPGTGYVLQDNRIIISATVQSTNPVSLNVNAKGQWVYQFGAQQQNDLLNLIKGKMVDAARTALLSAKGVATATIQYSGTTLPTDIGQMTFNIEMPASLPGTTTGGASASPTVTANSTPLAVPTGVGR